MTDIKNHPIQYAIVTGPGPFARHGLVICNTESKSKEELLPDLPPGQYSNYRIERYNRCPNCEQWSPCDVRTKATA